MSLSVIWEYNQLLLYMRLVFQHEHLQLTTQTNTITRMELPLINAMAAIWFATEKGVSAARGCRLQMQHHVHECEGSEPTREPPPSTKKKTIFGASSIGDAAAFDRESNSN